MTDTPHGVPYVPGPADHEPNPMPDAALAAPLAVPPVKQRNTPLLVGAFALLGILIVGLGVTVVVLAGGDDKPAVAVASSPAATTAAVPAAKPWSPPPPTDIAVPFGQVLELTDTAGGDVRYTVTADKVYTKTKYGTKPEKGALYGVKVSIEVVAGSVYACPCDFALIAKDGTAYEGEGYQVDGGLTAVTVNKGQKAAGVVVFDAPAGAQVGGRVELREGGRSQNQGFWIIP